MQEFGVDVSANERKLKLCYTREQMLAAYTKHTRPPSTLESLTTIFRPEHCEPMAFVPLTDIEKVWELEIRRSASYSFASHLS
jgi:hypothetical protein